jgi:glutamate/tyrosine decarboxylase-like PLP-dependent enzyme
LLYRDVDNARRTFLYTGSYAKQLSSDPIEGFAFFEESMELSRRCRAVKLWLSLRYHGLESFRAAIRADLDHAQQLAKAVDASPALERLAPVELSAVCFRHLVSKDASPQERNAFNLALLKNLIRRGKIYLSNAELKGKFCLRACIVNHLTKDSDIDAVVPEVLAAAREIQAE